MNNLNCKGMETMGVYQIRFSIIIPVYNVEKYLLQCVNSFLNQSFDDYEIILVNDGSTDKSGTVCDNLSNSHKNITVIHKSNGGLSSARNAGLEVSNGEYIVFADSDDFWNDNNALKEINHILSNRDVDTLIFPMRRYYEDTNTYTNIVSRTVDQKIIGSNDYTVVESYLIKNNIFRASACNKIVKHSLIDRHNLRFLNGYLSEDLDWCGYLLLYSNSFFYYDNPIYSYRQQRAGSITANSKSEKLLRDKLFMCEKGFNEAKELKDSKQYLVASYYAYEYAVLIGISSGCSKSLKNDIKNLQEILNYDLCKKVKLVKRVTSILGFDLTRNILCAFVKYKR